MALKGKRKQRGGQGKRKPAAMPRPQSAARKPPWYKTTAGLSIIAIGSLLALIIIIAFVVDNRNDARVAEQREEELDTYTGEIEALVQEVSEPASAVSTAAAGAASGAPAPEAADDWVKQFDDAQAQLFQLVAPQGAAAANTLFQQSVLMYRAAAKNFALAQQAEGEVASELQTQAATLAGTASALWETGKSVLDDVLEEEGLPPSDFRSPSDPGSQPQPQSTSGTEVTIPPSDNGGGGGGNNGGGGNDEGGGNGNG